jgi:hypothetical protein
LSLDQPNIGKKKTEKNYLKKNLIALINKINPIKAISTQILPE